MNNLPLLPNEIWVTNKQELKPDGSLTIVSIEIFAGEARNLRVMEGVTGVGVYLYYDISPIANVSGKSLILSFYLVWTGTSFKVPQNHTASFLGSVWSRGYMYHVYQLIELP